MSTEKTAGGFKRRPGVAPIEKDIEEFIAGAGKPVDAYPWHGLDNESAHKLFNLRLTEAQKTKLEFIVEHSRCKSMQEYCMALLLPAIEADIQRLTNTK